MKCNSDRRDYCEVFYHETPEQSELKLRVVDKVKICIRKQSLSIVATFV